MKRFYSEETLKAKLKIAFTNGQNNPDAGPMSAGITANMLLLPHAPSLTLPDPGEAWTPESYAAVMVSLGKSGRNSIERLNYRITQQLSSRKNSNRYSGKMPSIL